MRHFSALYAALTSSMLPAGSRMKPRVVLGLVALTVIWTSSPASAEATFQGLGFLPGGLSSSAFDVSADGHVAVGSALVDYPGEIPRPGLPPTVVSIPKAFYWTDGDMTSLGDLSNSRNDSAAQGASGDGSMVVGRHHAFGRPTTARLWHDGVVSRLWSARNGALATAISDDGSFVVLISSDDLDTSMYRFSLEDDSSV
jgi:uncharacterized membrane protein